MKKTYKSKENGFLQLIILIVLFVFIALYFGKNPVEIWKQYIEPVVTAGLGLFLRALNFLIVFITSLMK